VAEAFGAILQFLGSVLSAIYAAIPSYGLAIILLTLAVRVVLIPLTVKQIRSMTAMQRLQPELKRIQQKYKGDRQKMNEEMMRLYREHGVNPFGGCLPLLMQAPVFIALYSVLRAAVPVEAAPVQGTALTLADLPRDRTICRPVGSDADSTTLRCEVRSSRGSSVEVKEVEVVCRDSEDCPGSTTESKPLPAFVTVCGPSELRGSLAFSCRSPVGTGHLPRDDLLRLRPGSLAEALVRDRATFLGMHLACSPTQASSTGSIRQCTAAAEAGGASLLAYYGLVVLMMATTYYQQRQIARQATGPQAQQMLLMGRIMPLFLGFISLSIPAGVILYWVVSNLWTIGQQQYFLSHQQQQAPPPGRGKPARPKPKG
jgi:YidC/Oxa1 family membrane protein insertase